MKNKIINIKKMCLGLYLFTLFSGTANSITMIDLARNKYIMHNDACALTWSVLCYTVLSKQNTTTATHAVALLILLSG